MDQPTPIADNVLRLGYNDRESDLFEALWPLPRGVAFNAYLIRGEPSVLIDAVGRAAVGPFLDQLRQSLGGDRTLDYLVVNHMEPDHSGAIRTLADVFPRLRLIGNKKTAGMLEAFYGLGDRVRVVTDGEEMDFGGGRLRFTITPMLHWPETMMTYDVGRQILFSGDAFGGFGSLDGGLFDDEVDVAGLEDEFLRYFANIVAKYSLLVQKAIGKLRDVPVKVIAPTHGPVWRRDPQRIVTLYDRWSRHEAAPGVVLVYGSMYGSTEKLAEAVARGIIEGGPLPVCVHNVSRSHVSYILRDAWRYKGLVVGAPLYDGHVFPPMAQCLRLLADKGLKHRLVGVFGTYAWSGSALKELRPLVENETWEIVEPAVDVPGAPTAAHLASAMELGRGLAQRLRQESKP